MGDPHFDDLDSGDADALGDLVREFLRHDVGRAAQGLATAVGVVVGLARRDVPQGGLGLDLDELRVGLDGKRRLSGVSHLPHDDRRDLDRVAVGVVDLEGIGLEVVDPHRDLPLGRERQEHEQPRPTRGADVAAEELDDLGLPGLDDAHRAEHEGRQDEWQEGADDFPGRRFGHLRRGERDDAPDREGDERDADEEGEEAVDEPRRALDDVDSGARVAHGGRGEGLGDGIRRGVSGGVVGGCRRDGCRTAGHGSSRARDVTP